MPDETPQPQATPTSGSAGDTRIEIPARAMVVLIGAAGSGKSTFARKHFRPSQILSSDGFREMLSDNYRDQSVSRKAFDLIYDILEFRLWRGRLTVVDATNVRGAARREALKIAKRVGVPAVAIVFRTPVEVCLRQNAERGGEPVPDDIIQTQWEDLAGSLAALHEAGFERVYFFKGPNEAAAAAVEMLPAG